VSSWGLGLEFGWAGSGLGLELGLCHGDMERIRARVGVRVG
jgi:hypothetical protein